MILDRTLEEWTQEFPIISELTQLKETIWINPGKVLLKDKKGILPISMDEIMDASRRWERFAPYFQVVFPETEVLKGIIESPVAEISSMKQFLCEQTFADLKGRFLLKCDSQLPISGSIKARGGIYEVICHAESLALKAGILKETDDYSIMAGEVFRNLFSRYSIAVGSTGNLGLSIGIMASKLGFQATVHMSADARQWKKDMLRSKGVTVIEYDDDYSKAVTEGRAQAEQDDFCYFVDDENSKTLFLGYSVAALRLKKQLEQAGISVDQEHPLFVYLPCGVGGGPGGVAYGIKQVFGDDAHCFFAEPTHSPCMLLGMATGYHDKICVQDFGIDNKTAADGLAVGRASSFVGKTMEPLISGCYTISDQRMYRYLTEMADREHIKLEPSALAGMSGPYFLQCTQEGKGYQDKIGITDPIANQAVHLIWATGGNMVPTDVMDEYYQKGNQSSQSERLTQK